MRFTTESKDSTEIYDQKAFAILGPQFPVFILTFSKTPCSRWCKL